MSRWELLLCTDRGDDATSVIALLDEENISYQTEMQAGNLHILVQAEQIEYVSELASSQLQLEAAQQSAENKLQSYSLLQQWMRMLFPGWGG